jgi:hypothetical protein
MVVDEKGENLVMLLCARSEVFCPSANCQEFHVKVRMMQCKMYFAGIFNRFWRLRSQVFCLLTAHFKLRTFLYTLRKRDCAPQTIPDALLSEAKSLHTASDALRKAFTHTAESGLHPAETGLRRADWRCDAAERLFHPALSPKFFVCLT